MSRPGTSFKMLAVLAVLAVALGACDGQEDSAADGAPSGTAPAEPSKPPPEVRHTVGAGETLWDIARAYDVSVEQIMQANGMKPRDVRRLREGSTITVPGAEETADVETAADRAAALEQLAEPEDGAYHFLARGESLWTLARTYDVTVETIMDRNQLSEDDQARMRVGQPIIIPGVDKSDIEQAEPGTRAGIMHELVSGETVWDIAHAFQVSVGELMAANSLSVRDVTQLRDGMHIFIPGVEEDRSGRIRRKVSARERRALRVAERLGLGTRRAAGKLLRGVVEPRWIRAAGGAGRAPGTLRWPVTNGWFVRGYGSGEQGYHLAVDIMGKIGWNVRAAARGIVGYSGDGVRGYGNMVLMIHPGGWVTMYAHNSVNFVAAGEKMPRGGILAEVGSTGISRGPHVHFELIHSGRNCDPAALFRPGVRHRNGNKSRRKRARWVQPDRRPKPVRCAPRRRHPRSRWVIHEDPGELVTDE